MDIDRDALVKCFIAEADETLSGMEQTLVSLESQPANRANVEEVFRLAHTLKGNATLLDFAAVAEFSHSVENLLDKIREGNATINVETVTLLLGCVDVLRVMVADAIAGKSEIRSEAVAVFERLEELRNAPRSSQLLKNGAHRGSEPGEQDNAATAGQLAGAKVGSRSKTLRVDLEKLDHLVNLAGEIAISRGRLDNALTGGSSSQDALDIHREADGLFDELRHFVMRLRMVPIGPTLWQFNRSVRDLSAAAGKRAQLEVKGEDVELDTRVIELIRDPLMHMVRNAVDHGIESPDVRESKGKNPSGLISLKASHSAGTVVIQISDDGAGFNREEILKRARSRGLIAENHEPTEPELFRLAFEAGFSTADKITEISGRGVGMDVVRRNIDSLNGSVSVDSVENVGSTITMRIPLTLAIIDGFAVRAGDETYVIPLDSVIECLELPQERHDSDEGGVIELRGAALPFIRLRAALQLAGDRAEREQMVVISHGTTTTALVVDSLVGQIQAVVKPLGAGLPAVTGIFGSTILGDGRVALILDVPGLVREAVRRTDSTSSTICSNHVAFGGVSPLDGAGGLPNNREV